MYLHALSIGYAVPGGNFAASVHSVFRSALNLRVHGQNELLTLLASAEGDLPQGIRLDTPETFSFDEFQVGEAALCRDHILVFERRRLSVRLNGARRWRCDLRALEFDPDYPSSSAAWNWVWELLNKRQRLKQSEIVAEDLFRFDEPVQTGICRKVGEAIRDLVSCTRRQESADLAAVNSLIGLGSGLTPSGDDLLVGYMTGLWCTVRAQTERAGFVSSLGETIIRCSQNTTDISRTYLYHAALGQVSSQLAHLAEQICRGKNVDRLGQAAEAVLRFGHTSGMDTITGLLLGLAAWEGGRLLSI